MVILLPLGGDVAASVCACLCVAVSVRVPVCRQRSHVASRPGGVK